METSTGKALISDQSFPPVEIEKRLCARIHQRLERAPPLRTLEPIAVVCLLSRFEIEDNGSSKPNMNTADLRTHNNLASVQGFGVGAASKKNAAP